MIGTVEIYSIVNGKEELISSDNNIIVTGASEVIADMLSYPVTKELEESATYSSILNTSNFSIGAVSFGKAVGTYGSDDPLVAAAHYYTSALSSSYFGGGRLHTEHVSSTDFVSSLTLASSILNYRVNQDDTRLEPNSLTMYERSMALSAITSSILDYGHNKNYLALGLSPSGLFLGCFAPSAGYDIEISSVGGGLFSSTVGGADTFNKNGAMDLHGFLQVVPDGPITSVSSFAVVKNVNSTGGVITTSGAVTTFPAISVEIPIRINDLKFCHLYGGITTLGLWALDLKSSLASSTAPFTWINTETKVTPRKFKLFAKKSLTKNLLFIKDFNSGADSGFLAFNGLIIRWSINLNAGRYWG